MRVVLRCIEDDDGGNDKVEQKRGKLFRDSTLIDLTTENLPESNEMTITNNSNDDMEDDDDVSVSSL